MIGIITINDNNNYGNRLQNYAVYTVLSRFDKAINIIRPEGINKSVYPKNPIKFCVKAAKHIYRRVCHKQTLKVDIADSPFQNERARNFQAFNENIENGEILTKNFDYSLLDKYDYIVTGSDQVWNPKLYPNMYINMLGFAKPLKRVALAPSIACDDLSKEQKKEFKKYLKHFSFLSCREAQGSRIISELSQKKCITLLDPTLVLSKEEWDVVAKKPLFHDDSKKYMLLYFLGGMSEEYIKIVEKLKETTGLEVVNVYDKNSEYYSCGPAEFIYMIANSQLVLTDSFHASVFSYIYDKPFRIFEREGTGVYMNSRLKNLMSTLKIEDSVYISNDLKFSDLFKCQYDKKVLYNEQIRFLKYVESFLGERYCNQNK